jgi:2'-5' RNA ligase
MDQQQKRYEENWKEYFPVLGSTFMLFDPNPLYWIGFKLEKALYPEMQELTARLQQESGGKHRWLEPKELHVTLALPGRPDKPYTEAELPSIINKLQKIVERHEPFEVELGNLNCFPHVLFREIYSNDGKLFELHNAIADAIPFSEEPQYRYENFMPHMSLCYLNEIDSSWAKRFDFDRKLPFVLMKISRVEFFCDIGYRSHQRKAGRFL